MKNVWNIFCSELVNMYVSESSIVERFETQSKLFKKELLYCFFILIIESVTICSSNTEYLYIWIKRFFQVISNKL